MKRLAWILTSLALACQPTPPRATPEAPKVDPPKVEPPAAPLPPKAPEPPKAPAPPLHTKLAALQPGHDIVDAQTVTLDGIPLLHIAHLQKDNVSRWLLVHADLDPSSQRVFQNTTKVEVVGLRDLSAPGPWRIFSSQPKLRTRGMSDPVLLLSIHESQRVRFKPKSRRATGVDASRTLLVLDVRRGLRQMLSTKLSESHADGFGGMSLRNLRLERAKGVTTLRASRQDRLSARSARCLRPKPYDVVFELSGRHFQQRPTQRPASPCR